MAENTIINKTPTISPKKAMSKLSKVFAVIDTINEWTGKILSFLLIFMMLAVVYEVVARYFFNRPTEWENESVAFSFGALWFLSGGWALLRDKHVRMDILRNRLRPRWRAIAEVIGTPLLFAFVGSLLWSSWRYALNSIGAREYSVSLWAPPIYPIKAMIPLGALLLLLRALVELTGAIFTIITGKEAREKAAGEEVHD